MRKFLLTLLLLVGTMLQAQVVENPTFKARTGSLFTISRIERTAGETRLFIHAVFRPNWWVRIGGNCYVQDAATGKRYALKRAEGIELGKEIYMPESGQMDFVLVYEPLPAETTHIHHIDPDDTTNNEFDTYDIALTVPAKRDLPPLHSVRGNWFDAVRGGWALSVYDSLIIVDNRIYDNRRVRRRGKRIELTLQDRMDGRMRTLVLDPRRDGSCRLTLDGGKRLLTREARRATVPADDGYASFFCTDTAVVQGYIDGYDRRLGFESGMVYLDHVATSEDQPLVVPIAPDGTFACRLPLKHPMWLSVLIDNEWIPFFVEPGQTQTLCLDWEDVLALRRARDRSLPLLGGIHYMGDDAHLSYLLEPLRTKVHFGYDDLQQAQRTCTPDRLGEYLKPFVARWRQAADSLSAQYASSKKALGLIRHALALEKGMAYLDFDMTRDFLVQEDTTNEVLKVPVEDGFYDFLRRMPLDEPEVLACNGVDVFTNRFEYMRILWRVKQGLVLDATTVEDMQRQLAEHEAAGRLREDSLVAGLCGREMPFLWQVATVRKLKHNLAEPLSAANRRIYTDAVLRKVGDQPFLRQEVERLDAEAAALGRNDSYALPEGEATDIFRRIIAPHAGKVLFVDFWATSCGPCRSGIEATAELRRKYRNHPGFQFVYITSAGESPQAHYDKYVAEHLQGEACYRVSDTEFKYLRQLFQFNGIPHYVLVEKDGTISHKKPEIHSLENYLKESFPLDGE